MAIADDIGINLRIDDTEIGFAIKASSHSESLVTEAPEHQLIPNSGGKSQRVPKHRNRDRDKDKDWELMAPIFEQLVNKHSCTLEEAMMILDFLYNFRRRFHSEDQFNRRRTKKHNGTGHTRPNKIAGKYNPYPNYVTLFYNAVPRSLCPHLYESQTSLLLFTDKYIKGFFDSKSSRRSNFAFDLNENEQQFQTEWQWQNILSRCQDTYSLAQDKKFVVGVKPKEAFARSRRKKELRKIIEEVLDQNIFEELVTAASHSSPHMMASFWNICRILQVLVSQQSEPAPESPDYVSSLIDLLETFLTISPLERKDAVRISCKATWNMAAKGMAEAAKLLRFLNCIHHENQRKNGKQMQIIRRDLGLISRAARRKWGETLDPSPASHQILQGVSYPQEAFQSLEGGDRDCLVMTVSLSKCITGMGKIFNKKDAVLDLIEQPLYIIQRPLDIFDEIDGRRPWRSQDEDEDAGPSGLRQTQQLRRACESDGLCPRCKPIFSDRLHLEALLSSEGYTHLKPREVHKGKDAGCKLCAALHQRIQDLESRKSEPLRLRASLGEESKAPLQRNPPKYPEHTVRTFPYLAPLKAGMDSQWLLNESVRQIQECEKHHQQCPKKSVSSLPTRVIDVGQSVGLFPLRLHVSKHNEKAQYAALSYCWGVEQQVITTTSSIAAFQSKIPESLLPKTIRDAIRITRGLQIQYLWVDALCIIQDSVEDKSAEINKMGRIYKNARITIAALEAATAFDGFIREVQPLDGALMPFILPNHRKCSIKLAPVTHLPYPGTHSDHGIHLLDTRGWTLQEFLLSPRLLLFSHTEVLWQCQQVQVDPVLPSSRQYHPDDITRLPSSVFGLHSSDNVFNTKEERARIWISFIHNYSRRQFTLNEDRWYAMAGIINDLSQVWQDTCLAGHWKSCLAESMAWYCVPSDPPVPISYSVPVYTAPTWSWMSPWCPVNAHSLPYPVATIISCTVTPLDAKAPFGRLQAGILVLGAQAVLLQDLQPELIKYKVRDGFKFNLDKPTMSQNLLGTGDEFGNLFKGCFLLKLGRRRAHGGLMGLILEAVGDGCFRRIRLGEYHDPGDNTARFWTAVPWKQWAII
ncbi:hypothetical protein B7463_g9680, partial [Scytalidium lignicola]